MDNEKTLLANSITKAIAYQENGGKPNLNQPSAGQSGEMKSIFQFTPNTWNNYSQQIYGKQMPLNNDNETYVVQQKVLKWIDQGYNTSQIASMWNAGEGNPNAYKEDWRGTNSHGVSYDTPAYASGVLNYAKQFYQESSQNQDSTGNTQDKQSTPSESTTQLSQTGLLPQSTQSPSLPIS